jgi:hypothetical protein
MDVFDKLSLHWAFILFGCFLSWNIAEGSHANVLQFLLFKDSAKILN